MDVGRSWHDATQRYALVAFIDANLRGASQVLLQNNPATGLIILVAVCWGAVDAQTPRAAIGAVAGLVVGTTTALLLRIPHAPVREGLFGFNPLLTGVAISIYLRPGALMWIYLVIGAVVTTVVTVATGAVLKTWGVPPLTFPFVLTTWFLLLATYQFARLGNIAIGRPALPHTLDQRAAHVHVTAAFLTPSMLKDVSEVFLLGNWVTGALILVALAVSSRWAAGSAIAGAVVSTLFAVWVGASASAVAVGLYGFSAVLTAVALGGVFYHPSRRLVPYMLFGIVFTVVIQAALGTALAPVGIPTLTAPFVFATWLFLLPKRDLVQTEHHELPEHDMLRTR
ncbi:urea transporter [Dactylosporangium sp. NPDC048998]|uniref:urea transporter n=1 Tax=Dactylosporangium sp. NPDC048998 TaxID=3363976 RepID=UPI003721CFA3